MNKKTIQIIVIVLAFGISGVVLYSGFHKNSGSPVVQPVPTPAVSQSTGNTAGAAPGGVQAPVPAAVNPADILPYGSNLDFSVLKKQNLKFNTFDYPKVAPDKEVGILEKDLIKPEPSSAGSPGR